MTDAQTRRDRRDARANVKPGPKRAEPRSRPLWQTALIGLALIAGALGVAFVLTGDGPPEQTETAAVEIEGADLPPIPRQPGGSDPGVGQPAPVVEGVDFGDNPVDLLAEDQGTLVVFLAHWCPVCQREVPVIVDEFGDDRPEGVRIMAVPTSTDATQGNYPPSAWLDAEGWPFGVLVDSPADQIARAYGVESFPAFVAVGADGTVRARVSGEVPPEGLQQLVEVAGS